MTPDYDIIRTRPPPVPCYDCGHGHDRMLKCGICWTEMFAVVLGLLLVLAIVVFFALNVTSLCRAHW